MTRIRCDGTAAWAALQKHYDSVGLGFDMRQAFASDPGRFAALSQSAGAIREPGTRFLNDFHFNG